MFYLSLDSKKEKYIENRILQDQQFMKIKLLDDLWKKNILIILKEGFKTTNSFI